MTLSTCEVWWEIWLAAFNKGHSPHGRSDERLDWLFQQRTLSTWEVWYVACQITLPNYSGFLGLLLMPTSYIYSDWFVSKARIPPIELSDWSKFLQNFGILWKRKKVQHNKYWYVVKYFSKRYKVGCTLNTVLFSSTVLPRNPHSQVTIKTLTLSRNQFIASIKRVLRLSECPEYT